MLGDCHGLNTAILKRSNFVLRGSCTGKDEYVLRRSVDQLRLKRNAQPRVKHNTKQRPSTSEASAVGQCRIVHEDSPDASENRIGGMTQPLHLGAGSRSRKPMRLTGDARVWRRSELAVDR